MAQAALVFLGGGLGAVLRLLLNGAIVRLAGSSFPWGILVVNVVGSFVMGLLVGWAGARAAGMPQAMVFLTTGVLGGFTTFSSFSLDVVLLWERGEAGAATAYAMASLLLAVGGLCVGLLVGRGIA
jgi:fluoride exporter